MPTGSKARFPPSLQQEELHKGKVLQESCHAALGSVLCWAPGPAGVGATPYGEDGARQSCLRYLPMCGNLHGGHSLSRGWGCQKQGELPRRGSGLSWLRGHRGKGECCRAAACPCASSTRGRKEL